MKIRNKVFSYMSIIMVVFVAAILNIYNNSKILTSLMETSKNSYRLTTSFTEVGETALRFRVKKRSLKKSISYFEDVLEGMETSLKVFNESPGKKYLDSKLQKRWDNIDKLWKLSRESVDKTLGYMHKLEGTSGEQLFNIKAYMNIVLDMPDLAKDDRYKKIYPYIRDLDLAVTEITSTTQVLNKALTDTREAIELEVEKKKSRNTLLTFIVIIISVLSSLLIIYKFTGYIAGKIETVKDVLENMSEKNLSTDFKLDTKDEFQDLGSYIKKLIGSFSSFIYSTGDSIDKVNEITDTLKGVSASSDKALNEINDKISNMSHELTSLDERIDRSTSDMIDMDREVKSIVNSINTQSDAVNVSSNVIKNMTTSVSEIALITEERQETTAKLLGSVNEGGVYVENTYDNIKQVNDEITGIKELVDVIKNISDQTNILSMNAAIESAHAGEAGKGFSVVADEIRSLSEYTSNNVKEINSAINSIIEKISASLTESEKSANTYKVIHEDIREFSQVMSELTQSISSLARGGEEVLQSTNSVSDLNNRVMVGAQTIIKQSSKIEESMVIIKGNSREVTENMKSISRRTNSVLESFSGVNDMTNDTKERIIFLADRMNSFVLEK